MGAVYEYLTFNEKSSRDFEVWISGGGTFDAPERDVESISVPGRNGDLYIDNGRFKNITITYPAFITKNFGKNFDAFKAYMLAQRGYNKLADSYHPEHYRLAVYKNAITPKMSALNKEGSFDISFDCDPRRFLLSGDQTHAINGAGILKNPTQFDASPLLRVRYTGTYTINGTTVTVNNLTGVTYIDIDCDLQEAYCGDVNCNGKITLNDGEFPKLKPGLNVVAAQRSTVSSGGVTVTFSDECATESTNYDYIYIYYKSGSTWYRSEKLGGKGSSNNLAGLSTYIPATTFRIYWHSDSSVQDWGYKVDSVVAAASGTSSLTFTQSTPPSIEYEPVYVGANNLPESSHPYGANETAGYEVTLITNGVSVDITPRWWTI